MPEIQLLIDGQGGCPIRGMKQDVAETLSALQRALASHFRIVPVRVREEPIFLAVAVPLSPEVTGAKPRLPSGRGVTLEQAMISAGAEALELRASLAWANIAVIAALPKVDGRAVVSAQDMLSGAAVPVPAQSVYLDFAAATGEAPYEDANSTGCAVGATLQDARRQALLECIERDAIAFWWHGGVAANALPMEMIDASQPRLSWWLNRRPRRSQLIGLTTDIGVPVVLAVSCNHDGRQVACGAAARFDPAEAALSAVTEMIQTETAFEAALEGGNSEARHWVDYASAQTLPQFNPARQGYPAAWDIHDDQALLRRLGALDLRALAVELTLPDDPLPSVRVLVPGLCAMGGRIDQPRFRRLCGNPDAPLARHNPEPF